MQMIGMEFDDNQIHIALINKKNNLIETHSFKIEDLKKHFNVNPFYKKKEKFLIATGLDNQDVLIKQTPFYLKNNIFTKKAISFQKNNISSLDPSKAIYLPIYLKKRRLLRFFITTKEVLIKHLNKLKHYKIDPDLVTCIDVGLCHFVNFYFKNIKDSLIIHFSQNAIFCIYMKENFVENSLSLKLNFSPYQNEIAKIKKNKNQLIDVFVLNKKSKLFTYFNHLKKNMKLALDSLLNKKERENIPIVFTGKINHFSNLEKFLLNKKINNVLDSNELKQNKSHAICIGLALTLLNKKHSLYQFRKGKFTPKTTLKALGKQMFFFFFFAIFITLLFYIGISYKTKQINTQLTQKLINLNAFENLHFKNQKTFLSNNLTADLNSYEKKLMKETKKFPYFLTIPNVSKILYWLNSHKNLNNAQILSFNYEIEKYPNVFAKKQPYIVKIEIEFETHLPATARSFYDSLTKDSLINQNQEITWEVGNNKYKTSFYLKPQAKYDK